MFLDILKLLGSVAILAYLGLCVYAYAYADRLIFPHVPPSYADDASILKIETSAGDTVSARFLRAPESAATILYSHGNGEDLGHVAPVIETFRDRGFNVLAYDYPGYGTSTGTPTERSVRAAIEACYRHLAEERGIRPANIVLYGRSVGSGPSVYLASKRPVAGLVVDSGFTSAFRVLTRIRLLPWDTFNNLRRIDDTGCPVFFVHGTEDRIVPIEHGRRLRREAPGNPPRLWIEGAGHNNLIDLAGERYWDRIEGFIRDSVADASASPP